MSKNSMPFQKQNYVLLLAGLAIVILGFILMSGGGSSDPNQFSDEVFLALKEIKSFLFNNMYRAPKVVEMRKVVTIKLQNLFKKYFDDPSFLPSDWKLKSDFTTSETDLARMVADYISGMTDRYALNQYSKLFEVDNP